MSSAVLALYNIGCLAILPTLSSTPARRFESEWEDTLAVKTPARIPSRLILIVAGALDLVLFAWVIATT